MIAISDLPLATPAVTTATGSLIVHRAAADATSWRACGQKVSEGGGRLVALWASDRRDLGEGFSVEAAYALGDSLACVRLDLPGVNPCYPDLSAAFPAAARMQRSAFDLVGVAPLGASDERPWLRHDGWPAGVHPLRRDAEASARFDRTGECYPFVAVTGEGVHEIPVGPVHAGTIEPGHFRFSVLGERVMRLEEHLGYKHKGIEKRFESLSAAEGARLAGRVSGDSTVAYAWAYAMAMESAADIVVPERASALRALWLERERVANHLGDLGYIGNDAGVAFALAQFHRLKEDWLRQNASLCGHRLAMDVVVPGGVARDIEPARERDIRSQLRTVEAEVRELRAIFDDHAGLQDRLQNCGRVGTDLALRLGLAGMAARASGIEEDLRVRHPVPPYDRLGVRMATHREGDVASRVRVRFEEVLESLRLIELLLDSMPHGEHRAGCPAPAEGRFGAGWVEGWRGEVFVAFEAGPGGTIRRCHPHDPSWQNWPLLEHAVIGNIVPDFPLINKSFNLSYAGVDL